MKREYLFDIQKYLDHFVNKCCDPYIRWTLGGIETLPPPHALVGVNILLSHHRKTPPDKGLRAYKQEYFMLDFQDFLEYATSNLATSFQINSIPFNHCFYYQALPGSFDKPLFENKFGKFSVMAACLSRHENYLRIIVQFKVETAEYLKKVVRMKDLVTGNNNFPNFFVSLDLLSKRREAFSSEDAYEELCNRFPGGVQEFEKSDSGTPMDESLYEYSKYKLYPPFETDYEEYTDFWYWEFGGAFWRGFSQYLAENPPEDDTPKFERESYDYYLDYLKHLPQSEKHFDTELADHFEIARLMRFLPSYFDFMYDLVIREKKEVVHETLRIPRDKNKKKTKVVETPIYKTIKSIRVSYLAEDETRRKLKVPQREWTAPAYRFAVRSHWRHFSQSTWQGRDQDGRKLLGKTWVRDYEKGPDIESAEFGIRSPKVVIKIKQPLSYARDVLTAHEQAPHANRDFLNTAERPNEKPTEEWMYQERIKLTFGLRWIILKRDNYKCAICGKGAEDGAKLEVDHIVPVAKWGRTEESNLRTLCKPCNRGKGVSI
jgi:hypothetical protein